MSSLLGAGCNSGRGTGTQGEPDFSGTNSNNDQSVVPIGGDDGGYVPPVGDGGTTGDPTTCAQAASSKSYIGCDYYPTVTANAVNPVFDYAVVVSNPGSSTANVTITGGASKAAVMKTVAPGALVEIGLPWVTDLMTPPTPQSMSSSVINTSSVFSTGGAYHLVSDVPVLVYQFNALEYKANLGGKDLQGISWLGQCVQELISATQCYSFSNDASLLLPSTAMTDNYVITGIPGDDQINEDSKGNNPVTTPYQGSYAVITATAASTTVKIQLSATADIVASMDGKIVATPQNMASPAIATFSLGQGDVIELLTSPGSAHDLTGSIISASAPVQLIVGNTCTSDPTETFMGSSQNYLYTCDHVEETVLPIETWGKQYVVTTPTGPDANQVVHTVRIYGGISTAHLTYAPAVTGAPASVAPGVVVHFDTSTDFVVTGDNAFQVSSEQKSAQIVDPANMTLTQAGDPALSFFAATAQYRLKYLFLAPTDYDVSFVDVAVPTGATVTLDGVAVTTAPTALGNGFGVLHLPLVAGSTGGAHTLIGNMPVGIQVMGYGAQTSYQYPGGLDLKLITTPPPPIK